MSHFSASQRRRGLTLMQLLVLLALLLVLLGVLLAATARVRNAAERAESQNNLHNLTIAAINCADTHEGKLPPGPANWYPIRKGPAANNGYGPCLFHLLPFVEQQVLYKSTLKNLGDTPVYAAAAPTGQSAR